MKDTDNTTKKLIKNIISLLVSALVLIAATVAWFAVPVNTSVDRVAASIRNEEVNLTYYTTAVPTETLDWNSTKDALVIRDTDSSVSVPDYFSGIVNWTQTSTMDIDPLYPGEFRVYRVDFSASQASAVFSLLGVNCTTDADPDDVYNSIYTFTSSTIKRGTNPASSGPVSFGSLKEQMLDTENTAQLLNISAAQSGDNVSVYYLIGIPGTDKNETHDAIRQTGAAITIETVGLYGSSSSAEETPAE